jgi:hypothetical protein
MDHSSVSQGRGQTCLQPLSPALPTALGGDSSLTGLLRFYLGQPSSKKGKSWADLVVAALLAAAAEGNLPALKEVFDRVDGKPAREEVAAPPPLAISDDLARRILEAGRGPDDDPPED